MIPFSFLDTLNFYCSFGLLHFAAFINFKVHQDERFGHNQGPMAKAYLARDCGGEEGVIAAIRATPKSAATAVGDRGQLPVPSACVCRLSKTLCQWQSE